MAESTIEQASIPGLLGPGDTLPAIEEVLTTHDLARLGLGSRKGSKRAAYRNSSAQRPQQEKPTAKRVPVSAQIEIVRHTQGFTPYGYSEASLATGLIHDLGKPYSTAKRLSEIHARHKKSEAAKLDPNGAVSSVIRDMGGFITDANITQVLVGNLADYLSEVNPNLRLDALAYEMNPEFFLPLLRTAKVDDAVRVAIDDEIPYRNIGDAFDLGYMSEEYGGALEEANVCFMRMCTVAEARNLASQTLGEQALRSGFWDARLVEAEAFPPAKSALGLVRGVPARI